MLDTPVLLLIYNRPELTSRVFEEVRAQRPRELYVVADGPRSDRTGDDELSEVTRAIFDRVDWDCRVHRLFAERNMGCRDRVATGISWFFAQVERGIVLEDDCVPDPSFFRFCESLLERYAEDTRVMHIAGANFQRGRHWGDGSYYVSSYPTVWGWASWRRAWRHYDLSIRDFPSYVRDRRFFARIRSRLERTYWLGTLRMMYEGRLNTWDHAWTFAVWNHGGVVLVSNTNLVSNVGFGGNATHTTRENLSLPVANAGPVSHPSSMAIRRAADRETLRQFLRFYGRRARLRLWKYSWKARLAGLGLLNGDA